MCHKINTKVHLRHNKYLLNLRIKESTSDLPSHNLVQEVDEWPDKQKFFVTHVQMYRLRK